MLLLALSVEILGPSQDADDFLNGLRRHYFVPVSSFGQELRYPGLYLGENLPAIGAALIMYLQPLQIVLHQLVRVLLQGERYIAYAYFYNFLHFYIF